jgi:hypothetical protein
LQARDFALWEACASGVSARRLSRRRRTNVSRASAPWSTARERYTRSPAIAGQHYAGAIVFGARLCLWASQALRSDRVQRLAGADLPFGSIEEADELDVAVAQHGATDHWAIEHAERREQGGGGGVALVVVCHDLAESGLDQRPGWLQSNAWIWPSSLGEGTTACAGGSA